MTLPAQPAPSIAAARTLVDALIAHGMGDVVLAPGSRSAPLAYALAAAADAGRLRLHVRIDERSAGFLALGLARAALADGRLAPVGIVTTSGTAVANLHPAILEAHHGGLPLIALTADRPHELRGTGANQTTDQVAIFGTAARLALDVPAPDGREGEARDLRVLAARAAAAALGTRTLDPGPVQLNLSYRDPLAPRADDSREALSAVHADPLRTPLVVGPTGARALVDDALVWPLEDAHTVVVAGSEAGTVARDLAEIRGWALLAEVVSGAVGGPNFIPAHAQVLAHAAIARTIERVVVLGRPTLSRPVAQLLARESVEVIVIAPGAGPWPDAARNASLVLPAIPGEWLRATPAHATGMVHESSSPETSGPDTSDSETPSAGTTRRSAPAGSHHLESWRRAGARVAAVISAGLDAATDVTGPGIAREVAAACGERDVLVLGSSNPVRDLDLVAHWAAAPRVISNRGLAGIDGIVSTAMGVALDTQRAHAPADAAPGEFASRPVVRAFMGDLTFLHDVGGLLTAPGEPAVSLQIIVANDQGGSIFAGLEHGALAQTSPGAQATFDRVFSTPHTADLGAIARGYGVRHSRVETLADLGAALADPGEGLSLVEVVLPRSGRRAEQGARTAAIVEALGTAN